jgi:hypothetical protein
MADDFSDKESIQNHCPGFRRGWKGAGIGIALWNAFENISERKEPALFHKDPCGLEGEQATTIDQSYLIVKSGREKEKILEKDSAL